MFRLFEPFETYLWIAFICSIVLSAFIVIALDTIAPSDEDKEHPLYRRVTLARICKAVYHMFAALMGGEDYEWVTWPGRVLRLAVLFITMLAVATYTANLAAFFNRPAVTIRGPQDLLQLRSARVCLRYAGAFDQLKGYIDSAVLFPEPQSV